MAFALLDVLTSFEQCLHDAFQHVFVHAGHEWNRCQLFWPFVGTVQRVTVGRPIRLVVLMRPSFLVCSRPPIRALQFGQNGTSWASRTNRTFFKALLSCASWSSTDRMMQSEAVSGVPLSVSSVAENCLPRHHIERIPPVPSHHLLTRASSPPGRNCNLFPTRSLMTPCAACVSISPPGS